MWIFLNDSFLSIVASRDNSDELIVRARRRGDIKRVFGKRVKEVTLPKADYAYRAALPRRVVIDAIVAKLQAIDYPNFKNSVAEADRHDAYLDVWFEMVKFQNSLRAPPSSPDDPN